MRTIMIENGFDKFVQSRTIQSRTKCQGISILHTHAKFQASRFNNKKKST